MRTVNIGALKASLSDHIRHVKNGEEVVICERNKPVARIIPIQIEDEEERVKQLIARGVMTPPRKKRASGARWTIPQGKISDEVMEEVWRQERGEY